MKAISNISGRIPLAAGAGAFGVILSKTTEVSDFVNHKHLKFRGISIFVGKISIMAGKLKIMIKMRSRNVRLAKLDIAIAKFLASNDREERILAALFDLFLSKRDRVLEGKDVAKFRREQQIAKSKMHKILHNLKQNEVIRFRRRYDRSAYKMNYFYFLDPRFFKMLGKVRKSYHKLLLIYSS